MSPDGPESVCFGVFVQGRSLHDWERETVELLRQAGARALLIRSTSSLRRKAGALSTIVSYVAGAPATRDSPGADSRLDRPSVDCLVRETGKGDLRIEPEQQRLVSDHRLRFILFMGEGAVPEGLAACAELGVWQYARPQSAVGDYPFVHDMCRGGDVVSFSLEQITHDGVRRLLADGHFRARAERNASVTSLVLAEARRWPLRVLRHYLLNGALPPQGGNPVATVEYRSALGLVSALLFRDAMVSLKTIFSSYFILETWSVGFARMNFQSLLDGVPLSNVMMLPRLEFGRYIADPFILSTEPALRLLVEDFNDFECGRISEVTVHDPLGAPQAKITSRLESEFHLSYPFLFKEEGRVYCLPECYQSGAALLYEYEAGRLVPVSELLKNTRATDATIVFHEGRYWLFCGLEDESDQVNLYLYFSDALTGDWSPHPLNPVKTDVRSSRSAGPIIRQNGDLYRPAQDCSKGYGYGLSINRIVELSTTAFEETVVATLKPDSVSPSCRGLHTVSFADDLMVIDAKYHLVGLEPIWLRILRRARRIYKSVVRASDRASSSG